MSRLSAMTPVPRLPPAVGPGKGSTGRLGFELFKREKLDLAGCTVKSAPLARFADIITSDIAPWAKVVRDAHIPAD